MTLLMKSALPSRDWSIRSLLTSLFRHRNLILQLVSREVSGRYKGSIFGIAWSFFNPVLMLAVYTFVFSEIFKSKWLQPDATESKTQFAVILFAGMIVLNLFTEILNRAPTLIVSNVNYVKKVIFPIEVLPIVITSAALVHAFINLIVLLCAFYIFNGYLHWTIFFIPLVLLPLALLAVGIAWILASLGVFLRDVGQTIGIVTGALMFISPVFFPVAAVPERFRFLIHANPLTFIIEQTREVLIWGHQPSWLGLATYAFFAALFFWLGFVLFQKTRKGFADVL
jgi:lipopolysaccharide transport system permease protein